MSLAKGREKITILRLMVVTAALAVMIRGFVEAPREAAWDKASRIIDLPETWQIIAEEEAVATKWAARGSRELAEHHREKAEAIRRVLRAKPPDPIGHVCFVTTLFTTPLVIAVIVVRGVIRWRRRCGPAC